MQAVSTSSLFQSAESEQLGHFRSAKAQVVSEPGSARYGYPLQLDASFDARLLVSEGAGADGGRFRVLASKVSSSCLYTAEAGGVVRRTDLETGRTIQTYKGAQGPISSIDLVTSESSEWLVTGSWDKALRIYKLESSSASSKTGQMPLITVQNAMDDFIKCVHIFSCDGSTLLAVGGSDKSVKVFDLTPALQSAAPSVEQIRCLYQLKSHSRPVNALASLVGLDKQTRVYSADSMGRVLESVWDGATSRLEVQREILGFETAIYNLRVFWKREIVEGQGTTSTATNDSFLSQIEEAHDGSLYQQRAVLWGASGDKSVAGYLLSTSPHTNSTAPSSKRAASIAILGTLPPISHPYARVLHPDYVKSVLPLSLFETLNIDGDTPDLALLEHGVVTGSSDDQLRLFPNPSTVASKNEDDDDDEKRVYVIEGHWNEITSLEPWIRRPTDTDTGVLPIAHVTEYWIISTGLDGTIRRWKVDMLKTFPVPQFTSSNGGKRDTTMDAWNADSLPTEVPRTANGTATSFTMTAEEEAELAELMDSD